MPRSIKMIAMTAALLLVVGVAPAYADDDTTDTTEAPEIEAVEGDEGSEGSHVNGKLLVLFGKGFDFSKGSALGELIDEYLVDPEIDDFNWETFAAWLGDDFGDSNLSEGQIDLLANPPRNFGQLVSALRKHHGRNENSPVYAAAQEGDGDGDGEGGDAFDAGAAGDEENGKGKKPNHPNKGDKPDHPNKGGKKNNG